jgi:hypothetical protein
MTIHVTPEQDGSYTVSCGSETVIVGIPRPAGTAGGGRDAISWPDDPEGNPNGVRAYLAVRPPRLALLQGEPGVFQIDLTADGLENTHEIATHVQDQLLKRPASKSTEPLEVHVTVEPGRSIDIESVMNRLNGVAQSRGTRIVLYIEVGAARIAGSGI